MKPTDTTRAGKLAAAVFADQIVGLARRRKAAGKQEYFPLGPEPGTTSYYEQPASGTMSAADFELPGDGTTAGLIDALAARWRAEGELDLAALAPPLKKIAKELESERAQGDGAVDILCYTMF